MIEQSPIIIIRLVYLGVAMQPLTAVALPQVTMAMNWAVATHTHIHTHTDMASMLPHL